MSWFTSAVLMPQGTVIYQLARHHEHSTVPSFAQLLAFKRKAIISNPKSLRSRPFRLPNKFPRCVWADKNHWMSMWHQSTEAEHNTRMNSWKLHRQDEQISDSRQYGLGSSLGRYGPVCSCPCQRPNVAEHLIRTMGQLFMMGFDGTEVTPQIRQLIEVHHLGTILLTAKNLKCLYYSSLFAMQYNLTD